MENTNVLDWNDAYSIGHEEIDKEHEKLFILAKKVTNCQDDKNEIMKAIKELIKYTKFHFAHEEKYMELINYSGYLEHKLIHENIINQLNDFIKQIPTLSIEKFERLLIEYMDVWLIQHIIIEDTKIIASLEGLTTD